MFANVQDDRLLEALRRRRSPARVRNCAACGHEAGCRKLAEQWGPSAMACRRATRDECFQARGSLPLRTCARCGTEHYTSWCTWCGFTANAVLRGDGPGKDA